MPIPTPKKKGRKLATLTVLLGSITGLICNAEANGAVYNKVLFVGDSITQHGPAVEKLGWSGNWGMAASSQDKDYVHLFLSKLAASQNGTAPETLISAAGGGKLPDKLPFLAQYQAFGADLAIIQMGENDNADVSVEGFQKPYEQILQAVRQANPKARVLCFGVWSPPNGNAKKDAMIQAACQKYGTEFVYLDAVNQDLGNKAASENRFTHAGVNWHPGDKGMQAYAAALWAAFTGTQKAPTATAATANAGQTVIVNEPWDGTSNLTWLPVPNYQTGGGKKYIEVTATETQRQVPHAVELPVEAIKGRKIVVEMAVKADSISPKPKPYNGIKIAFRLTNAEGQINYPQYHMPVGSFDWTPVKWTSAIPDNLVKAQLILGLESVTGTVDFDAVKISVLP
ncbi:MAG: SGNH/GDSL hydrolase family protein [Chthoniobacteraceae bacterium]